ncbi:MAG: metallophosphoesterase [Lutibacter sp.]|nr:metallophosphoesterase [Lutibacter sp.]
MKKTMIDFIGDIHGHADELEALLKKMGYTKKNKVYSHPERKVLFVGDYIDRGPKIRKTLKIVRRMVESDNAIALMGNHEYNAICFHYPETKGGHLRNHSIKNILQHYKTLKEFKNRQDEYDNYIDWFKTLPLFYETEYFRAVHASWIESTMDELKLHLKNGRLTEEAIINSVKNGSLFNNAIEDTLKGKEIPLNPENYFKDKDGFIRENLRIKWWEDPSKSNYKELSIHPLESLPDTLIDVTKLSNTNYYPQNGKPVFFGHYWLKEKPAIFRDNICCLDYSVAKKGKLVAYRFSNEKVLSNKNIIYV